jgi:hypothetical protein
LPDRLVRRSYDLATARNQGWQSAEVSANAALALGIGPGSAIYSDIEAYPTGNTACREAILSYVTGWTEKLRSIGFLSGVYSSAGSGGRDLANAAGDSRWLMPDHFWFAWWNGVADTDGGSYIADGLWVNHQRLHQYRGDHNETWGGVTINIDSNFLDVAGAAPPPMTDGVYRIKAEVGGFDLDVRDCQTANGADVRMWDRILDSPCQKWHLVNVGGSTFKILDGNTGKALDVAGCSASRDADVIWPFHGGSCQRWYFTPV